MRALTGVALFVILWALYLALTVGPPVADGPSMAFASARSDLAVHSALVGLAVVLLAGAVGHRHGRQ